MSRPKKNYLEMKRTIKAEVITYNYINYIRVRDVCDILGIKQPFEFTKDIKAKMGNAILKNAPFRGKKDSNRTVFISVQNMYDFMIQTKGRMYAIPDASWMEMIQSLKAYL